MNAPRKRAALTAIITALALAVLAIPTWQAVAAESDVTLDTWVWNIAGGNHGTHEEQAAEVASSIEERDPDFAVLTELCGVQYESLKKRLVDNGWTEADNFARFTKMDDRNGCRSGDHSAVGFGLFSKHDLTKGADSTQLTLDPHSKGREHFLTCVTTQQWSTLRLCGTHITPPTGLDGTPNDTGVKQIVDVRDKTDSYLESGDAVVMAGDFNAMPHWPRLNQIYSDNVPGTVNVDNHGGFRELDDNDPDHCLGYGEATVPKGERPEGCDQDEGAKIDMIFASEAHINGGYEAEVMPMPETCQGVCSDHHGMVGTVPLTM